MYCKECGGRFDLEESLGGEYFHVEGSPCCGAEYSEWPREEPVVHREVLVWEWDFLKHLIEARGKNK